MCDCYKAVCLAYKLQGVKRLTTRAFHRGCELISSMIESYGFYASVRTNYIFEMR